jgi:hypothetical protein
MAKLPRQVADQLARADATLAAANNPPPADPPLPEPPPAPPVPSPEPVPQTPPPPPVPGPATPPPEDFQHKYRVLQGMFNKQAGELQELKQTVEKLHTAPPAPPVSTEPPKPVVDPKDVEAFGLDMVSMVQRVADQYFGGARQAIETQLATLTEGLAELRQTLQGTSQSVAVTAEQRFFDKLSELVPEWPQINQADAFLAFLSEVDPIYGRPRQIALDEAHAHGDAQRASLVFKAFIGTLPPPPATPAPGSPSPTTAGSPQPSMPAEKPVYTSAQFTAFYDDVRKGKYRGNPAEQARIEALFNAAMAEGRIR